MKTERRTVLFPAVLAAVLLQTACTANRAPAKHSYRTVRTTPHSAGQAAGGGLNVRADSPQEQADYLFLLLHAEQQADGKSRLLLEEARKMTLFERAVVKGGCWDYLDRVYTRAGVPRNSRQVVHTGSLKGGPYADADQIRAGDWLYHINHGYRDTEHSGMFVAWVDKAKRQALMLSYAGEGRKEPARYKVYDLRSVYGITRAK